MRWMVGTDRQLHPIYRAVWQELQADIRTVWLVNRVVLVQFPGSKPLYYTCLAKGLSQQREMNVVKRRECVG